MGSPENEGQDEEHPQHRVKLSGFWMSATEVTNAQYNRFLMAMEAKGGPDWEAVRESGSRNPGLDDKFKGENLPVVKVSYEEALAFCEWVGHGVTLPTEAQWEYACRAGSSRAYGMGDDGQPITDGSLSAYAWFGDGHSKGCTYPVGKNRASAFGLYDMHGNVWEWCSDWYGEDYYQKCKDRGIVTDPTGAFAGLDRVIRGGSWYAEASLCRSAFRYWDTPGYRTDDLGFRVVVPVAK